MYLLGFVRETNKTTELYIAVVIVSICCLFVCFCCLSFFCLFANYKQGMQLMRYAVQINDDCEEKALFTTIEST